MEFYYKNKRWKI